MDELCRGLGDDEAFGKEEVEAIEPFTVGRGVRGDEFGDDVVVAEEDDAEWVLARPCCCRCCLGVCPSPALDPDEARHHLRRLGTSTAVSRIVRRGCTARDGVVPCDALSCGEARDDF